MKYLLSTALFFSGALAAGFGWSPPSAAITWPGNLQHIRTYAVDPNGIVSEWQWDGGGWTGPKDIGARARVGTSVTATNYNDRIRVYYQTPAGGFAEHLYEPDGQGWRSGAKLP